MNILVIDGMGGGMGKAIIEHITKELHSCKQTSKADMLPEISITAVGTNSIATSAMLKAGANFAATGENAIIYNCAKADCIVGVMGIVFANSMHGEISPKMAEAISSADAHKILIPTDKCNVTVLGVAEKPVQAYIGEIVKNLCEQAADI